MKAIIQIDIPLSRYTTEDKVSPVPATDNTIVSYSKKAVSDYCKKYGHDHILMTEPVINYNHPVWERLDFWFNKSWFDKYDEILYVDTDVYPLPDAPDIFKECDRLDVFKRIFYQKAESQMPTDRCFDDVLDRYKEIFFNTGVILLSKNVVEKTLPTIKEYRSDKFRDDGVLINYAVMKSDLEIVQLDRRYNVKLLHYHLNQKKHDVYFFHAMGLLKKSNPQSVKEFLRNIYG